MKKIYLLLVAILCVTTTFAQTASDYHFYTEQNVTTADMSGATQVFGMNAEDLVAPVALPFNFQFHNQIFNQVFVSSNGYLAFGSTLNTNGLDYDNRIEMAPRYPIVTPWWDQLNTYASGSVNFKVTGVTGSRIAVVDWKTFYQSGSITKSDFHFQVWLYEGSNHIRFVYGNGNVASRAFGDDMIYQAESTVGLAGDTDNYIGITVSNHTPTSVTSSIKSEAGTTLFDHTQTWPGAGRSYLFSPKAIVVPSTQPAVVIGNGYALAGKTISIGESNNINGAIGGITLGNKVSINNNSVVSGNIMASSIVLASSVSVSGSMVYQTSDAEIPALFVNDKITSSLSNLSIPDDFTGIINGNYKDVSVGKRATVTFTGQVFARITVKEGADVIFENAEVFIDELKTDAGKSSSTDIDFSTVTFKPGSRVVVKHKVTISDRSQVTGEAATIYIADQALATKSCVISGKKTTFSINVVIPRGEFEVKSADSKNVATINGYIVAESIKSDKYVNWFSNTTSSPATVSSVSFQITFMPQPQQEARQAIAVKTFPNPSNGSFSLQLDAATANNAMVIINDNQGKMIAMRPLGRIESITNFQFNLYNQPPGIYYLKIIGEKRTQTTKLIITK